MTSNHDLFKILSEKGWSDELIEALVEAWSVVNIEIDDQVTHAQAQAISSVSSMEITLDDAPLLSGRDILINVQR